jgi:hypothetical protein
VYVAKVIFCRLTEVGQQTSARERLQRALAHVDKRPYYTDVVFPEKESFKLLFFLYHKVANKLIARWQAVTETYGRL